MTTTAPVWSVREYLKTDGPTVSQWWGARHLEPFPFPLLPPLGIVAEDEHGPVAMCWLYMAVNVGVCWIEHALSKPGIGLAHARAAFRLVIETLERAAKANDYGYMIAHTTAPVCRILRGFGFLDTHTRANTVAKILCLPPHS